MKKLLYLFSFVSTCVFAQNGDYEFSIKDNDPTANAYDLSIKLNPFFTDISNDNTVMGYSPSLFFRISTVMALHGEFLGSYYNNIPETVKSSSGTPSYNGVVDGDYVPFQYLNGGATLYLWSETYEKGAKVGLPKQKRNGGNQRYFLEIKEVEKIRQFGFRATSGKYQGQIAEKGLEFDGVDPDPNVIIANLNNTTGTNYSSISYSLYSAGFCYEELSQLEVDIKTDSLGLKSKKNHWKLYADFLIAQNMQLSDMLYTWDDNGTETSAVYDIQKYTIPDLEVDIVPYLGYRVGFEFSSTGKVGYTYGVEAGTRPGTGSFLARTYLNAKFGMSLNWRLLP